MSADNIIVSIYENCPVGDQELDVVFVHGISGNWRRTWCPKGLDEKNKSWPEQLGMQLSGKGIKVRVSSVDYPARSFGKSFRMESQTGYVFDQVKRLKGKRIIFICHSLGGILVKMMLRKASAESHDLLTRTAGILFLGTPHLGARAAWWMRRIGLASRTLKELEPEGEPLAKLEKLDAEFCKLQARHNWRITLFAEGLDTGPGLFSMRIVREESAYGTNTTAALTTKVPALNHDHVSLPKARKDVPVFQNAMDLAKAALPPANPVMALYKRYTSLSPHQRSDLFAAIRSEYLPPPEGHR